jgi:hypothetical protein
VAKTTDEEPTRADLRGGTMHVPRRRGALSGIMLILLGIWGALIPFVGPYFNFSYLPDSAWHWTAGRGWLEVLPGVVAIVGGLMSLVSANRAVISLGAWLGVAAGAWYIIGLTVAGWFHIGSPGAPAGSSTAVHSLETLALFTGLGALILFFAASAVGRLSVHSVSDVRAARRRAAKEDKRNRKVRGSAYEEGRKDGLAEATGDRSQSTDGSYSAPAGQYPAGQYPTGQYPAGQYPPTTTDQSGATSATDQPRR